jgi:subtilisin family serine protease
VVQLSLGVPAGSWSRALEAAVRALVEERGFTVVVASGNSAIDACDVTPANVGPALTVAGSNIGGNKFDRAADRDGGGGGGEPLYRWSNTGRCVDVFAPGVEIFSACGSAGRCERLTPDAYTFASGTSMAAPLVAGVAAVYLGEHPGATPAEVHAAIIDAATRGALAPGAQLPGTPNALLFSRVEA